jgi:hypothetical protein
MIKVKEIMKQIQYPHACKDSIGRLRVGAPVHAAAVRAQIAVFQVLIRGAHALSQFASLEEMQIRGFEHSEPHSLSFAISSCLCFAV